MCNEQDVAEHAPLRVQRQQAASGLPHFAINGLDVIEGNEGGPRPLICEA
jgi:hypothetical protein